MIKKILLVVALCLPMFMSAQKFAVVDVETVITAMPEYTQMNTQLTETSRRYETEFTNLQEEINQLMTQYQAIAEDAATPQSIKDRRTQEIQEKMQRVEQFRNTAQQDLARLQEQLLAPITQKYQDAVKAVGAEQNFTLVLPNEPQLVIYAGSDVVNITAAVKAKLGI